MTKDDHPNPKAAHHALIGASMKKPQAWAGPDKLQKLQKLAEDENGGLEMLGQVIRDFLHKK